jgi:hypothetical protein
MPGALEMAQEHIVLIPILRQGEVIRRPLTERSEISLERWASLTLGRNHVTDIQDRSVPHSVCELHWNPNNDVITIQGCDDTSVYWINHQRIQGTQVIVLHHDDILHLHSSGSEYGYTVQMDNIDTSDDDDDDAEEDEEGDLELDDIEMEADDLDGGPTQDEVINIMLQRVREQRQLYGIARQNEVHDWMVETRNRIRERLPAPAAPRAIPPPTRPHTLTAMDVASISSSNLIQDFHCAICFELLVGATLVHPCGHVYCQGCFPQLATCPECRQVIRETSQDRLLDRSLLYMLLHLPHLFPLDDRIEYSRRTGIPLNLTATAPGPAAATTDDATTTHRSNATVVTAESSTHRRHSRTEAAAAATVPTHRRSRRKRNRETAIDFVEAIESVGDSVETAICID